MVTFSYVTLCCVKFSYVKAVTFCWGSLSYCKFCLVWVCYVTLGFVKSVVLCKVGFSLVALCRLCYVKLGSVWLRYVG